MQKRKRLCFRTRGGFKLIDLLVVVFVVGLLAVLVVPALYQTKRPRRRSHCLNNLRNLGTAMHSYAATNRGQLPGYGTWSEEEGPRHNWAVDLLPYIDRQDIADRWNHAAPWDSNQPGVQSSESNAELSAIQIRVLQCTNSDNQSLLNYVVNAGLANRREHGTHDFDQLNIDWNGDGEVDSSDHEIAKDTGVFWRTVGKRIGGMQIDSFYDGGANTIMMSERLDSGMDSWASPRVKDSCFVYPVDPTSPSIGTAQPDPQQSTLINDKTSGPPMLSSNHDGGVGIVNGEGGARFLSSDIDPDVLRRLVTPSGTLYDEEPIGYGEF